MEVASLQLLIYRRVSLTFALLALTSCDYVLRPKPELAQTWHASQLAAVAQQWQADSSQFKPAQQPPRPWGIGRKVERGYSALYSSARAEQEQWQTLLGEAVEAAEFSRALLKALHARDATRIQPLSAELDTRRAELALAIGAWHGQRQTTVAAQEQLQAELQRRCPAGEFPVDLQRLDVGEVRSDPATELEPWRERVYSELAATYLGTANAHQTPPVGLIATSSAPPTEQLPVSAQDISAALEQLEVALAARSLFEKTAERDAELAQLFQPLAGNDRAFNTADARRYREQRLPIARARLALLSHVDSLLSMSEDVLQTEVTRQWQRAWPDCPLETNVYAYAGLPRRSAISSAAARPR